MWRARAQGREARGGIEEGVGGATKGKALLENDGGKVVKNDGDMGDSGKKRRPRERDSQGADQEYRQKRNKHKALRANIIRTVEKGIPCLLLSRLISSFGTVPNIIDTLHREAP